MTVNSWEIFTPLKSQGLLIPPSMGHSDSSDGGDTEPDLMDVDTVMDNHMDQSQSSQDDDNPLDDNGDDGIVDNLMEAAQLDDIKISLQFIHALTQASSSDGMSELDEDILARLQDPPTTIVELSPDDRLSLKLFLASQNAAQDVYTLSQDAILERHPEDNILSYNQAKRLITEITGISSITDAMCINSCMAYTGPFKKLDICPYCAEPCLDPGTKKSRKVLNSIPLGPQLQALK